MRRRKFITFTTEQDIDDACEYMDRRERDVLVEFVEIAECDDDERTLVLQARSSRFDDGW